MIDLRKAAEMALEALEFHVLGFNQVRKMELAIEALEQALAQPEQGCAECGVKASDGYALYCVKCTEPMREWVSLTDEEIEVIAKRLMDDKTYCSLHFAVAIEAALRSKNT
jgi:hypothetical protein